MDAEDNLSDDEIFMGRLSIKEIKKHIYMDRHRKTISSVAPELIGVNNESLHIIETHSEPDIYSAKDLSILDMTSPIFIRHPSCKDSNELCLKKNTSNTNLRPSPKIVARLLDITGDVDFVSKVPECHNISLTETDMLNVNNITSNLKSTSSPDIRSSFKSALSEESFIKLETMVENLCMSPNNDFTPIKNNTGNAESASVQNNAKTEADDSFFKLDTKVTTLSKCNEDNIALGLGNSPDITCTKQRYSLKSPNSDESFLKLESMVTNLCMSPKDDTKPALDNTLDVVEFILNNNPPKEDCNKIVKEAENVCLNIKNPDTKQQLCLKTEGIDRNKTEDSVIPDNKETENSQIHQKDLSNNTIPNVNCSDSKSPLKNKNCYTPLIKNKPDHVFKTPKTLSCQKQSSTSLRKTPGKYKHITSPIASYIKKCPQTPLLKDVHPKKPLPGVSSIPKMLKSTINNKRDKENIHLPSLAYKCAKKTEMVTTPDKTKISQGQWMKKLTNSLSKPVVIKHDHRHINTDKKPHLVQEDSFANLTLHQAELSVCTEKPAF